MFRVYLGGVASALLRRPEMGHPGTRSGGPTPASIMIYENHQGARSAAPFLLTMPDYRGTLAAARCLGRHGVSVTIAGGDLLAPARWSRHVTRWVRSPDVFDTERFFEWLLEFGRQHPGHVLYPTCDDLVWLFAARAAELAKYFHLHQPGVEVVLKLLDKKALYEACRHANIGVVDTKFPETHAAALRLADELDYPLLLKPRTQVLLPGHGKGAIVDRYEQFPQAYDRFVNSGCWPPTCGAFVPGVEVPMLQQYLPQASESIYSLAGFIGRGVAAVRASQKLMQRPRRVGVGLAFEEAPVNQSLLESLTRLCEQVGYFGVFEAEFVKHGDDHLLIDFNPRFYGQMGFEVARGLPLAYLVWLAALGEDGAVDHEIAKASQQSSGRGYAYCDRFFLNLGLWAQGLSGRMPWSEVRRWFGWQRDRKRRSLMVDASGDPEDRLPGMVAAVGELVGAVRHPRTSVLTILGGS